MRQARLATFPGVVAYIIRFDRDFCLICPLYSLLVMFSPFTTQFVSLSLAYPLLPYFKLQFLSGGLVVVLFINKVSGIGCMLWRDVSDAGFEMTQEFSSVRRMTNKRISCVSVYSRVELNIIMDEIISQTGDTRFQWSLPGPQLAYAFQVFEFKS